MQAQVVADAFALGRASSLIGPVARGELGAIHRLETDRGLFAIKQEFEASPVADAEASTLYHRVCWEAGIPTPEPLRSAAGGLTTHVNGERIRAYTWAEMSEPDPLLDPAAVGRLLAQLHHVGHRWARVGIKPWFELPIGPAKWTRLLEESRAAGAPHADRLGELLPGLLAIEETLTPMRPVQVLHLDLWADNLRCSHGRPFVIDFDNAGPGDPSREIAMVVWEFGRLDGVRSRTLYDAYVAEGGPGRIRNRADFGLAVAELHHIGHRHLSMWIAARDAQTRARSLTGIDEFLAEALLLPEVDALLTALG